MKTMIFKHKNIIEKKDSYQANGKNALLADSHTETTLKMYR